MTAVVVKPRDSISIYGAYSISYLPSSGDQFSALTDGTLILEPQKFENKEVGVMVAQPDLDLVPKPITPGPQMQALSRFHPGGSSTPGGWIREAGRCCP